jgi:Leucine-rich repeat (LRR) protein
LLALLIPASVVRADSVVTFPDPNLEEAIRRAIGKTTNEDIEEDIYQSDLLGLTELESGAHGISSLTGLELCPNLKTLNLDSNQISDISPLSSLIGLTDLSLGNNQVSEISPLSGLSNLRMLSLSGNQISDISPLSGPRFVDSRRVFNTVRKR